MRIRKKIGRNSGYVHIDKHVLEDLYITKKLSQREIAKIFSVSHTVIFLRMKECGIQARPSRFARKLKKD